jgi:hypothetical protein
MSSERRAGEGVVAHRAHGLGELVVIGGGHEGPTRVAVDVLGGKSGSDGDGDWILPVAQHVGEESGVNNQQE